MEPASTPCSQARVETSLAHVAEPHVLLTVFAALIVLTAVTVAVSYFDLGAVNLMAALAVATIKAALVALWFMHLRHKGGLGAFIFLVGVAFLGLFLILAMFDAVQYHANVQSWEHNRR